MRESKKHLCRLFLFALVLFVFVLTGCDQYKQNEHSPRILLIHSFSELDVRYVRFNELISDGLRKNGIKADIHPFYLNCEVLLADAEEQAMYKFLEKEQTWKPDLIMVVDDQATYSLMSCNHPIVKTVPIVFAGVSFPNWKLLAQYPNATGFYNTPDYKTNIQLIEQLMGKMYLTVNNDRFFLGRKVNDLLLAQTSSMPVKLDYTPLDLWGKVLDLTETIPDQFKMKLKEQLNERPDSTTISLINFQQMTAGSLFRSYNSGDLPYRAFLNLKYDFTSSFFASRQKTLAFTAVKDGFGHSGFLAGYFTSQRILSEDHTRLVANILKGGKVEDIPYQESRKEYLFDWKEMKRWNIKMSRLPSGATIVNMPIYERYLWLFIVIGAMLLISVIGVILYLMRLYMREQQRKIKERKGKESALEALKLKQIDLEFALSKAQEADRMKSVFLANMSHEIRTPLNAIIGFTELLNSDVEIEEEDRSTFVALINQNSDLLLKLINDILDLSRIESGQISFVPTPCNLTEVMNDVFRTHQLLIPSSVEFRKMFPDQAAIVAIDKLRLIQVMTNLINNAVKFTEAGFIELGYFYDEQCINIYVEDTGKGIPEDKQQLVFNQFVKVDEFIQGTGLGLSICRAIVESQGGVMRLQSRPGEGSRFTMELPYHPLT